MGVVVIRNGIKLCEKCRKQGCMRYLGGLQPDQEEEHVSDEPCECCEQDVVADDGFGI